MKYETEMEQFLDAIGWLQMERPVDEAHLEQAWQKVATLPRATLAKYVWEDAFAYPLNRKIAVWVNRRLPWQKYGGSRKAWRGVDSKGWIRLLTSNPWLIQWLDPRTRVDFSTLFLAAMNSKSGSGGFNAEHDAKIEGGQKVWDWMLAGVKRQAEWEERDIWMAPNGSELTYDEQYQARDEDGVVIPQEQWLAGDLYMALRNGMTEAGLGNNQEGVKYLLEYPGWQAVAAAAGVRRRMIHDYSIETEALEAFEASMEEHLVKQTMAGRGVSGYERNELQENAPKVWKRGNRRIKNWELRRSLARLLPPGKPEAVARL